MRGKSSQSAPPSAGAEERDLPPQPPKKRKRKRTRARRSSRFALSIPKAGAMVGLSRSASYRAANDGSIPTLPGTAIVPRLIWQKLLGIESPPEAEAEEAETVD